MTLDPRGEFGMSDKDLSVKADVGSTEGTTWLLSSAKARNGVAQLMDDDLETLWQSEGNQPHYAMVHFCKRTAVTVSHDCIIQHVSIYLDCRRDDSYTPTKILIKAGTHPYDLVEVRYREFVEPQGWFHFLLDKRDLDVPEEAGVVLPLRSIDVFVLQICILGNHLNGKDTHIRSIKVFGPPSLATQIKPANAPTESVQRLVRQGMRTDAFRKQVARVGHDRAIAQLQRIMQQHSHTSSRSSSAASSRSRSLRSSLENTLR